MNKFGFNLVGVFALFCLTISPADAYLDPGTGSMIIQGLIAGIASIALILKLYWHRLMVLLGLREKTIITDDDDEIDNESPDDNKNW